MPGRLKRKPDWSALLAEYIAERADSAFEWGEHDCALFAADWIHKATGTDPAAVFRGRYDSEKGAARILRFHLGLVQLVDSIVPTRIPPKFAGRGDIVLVQQHPIMPTLAVVGLDGRTALAPGADRLYEFPMDDWTAAWRIG